MSVTKDLGLVSAIHVGNAAPSNIYLIWYNTANNLHYHYDPNILTWIPFSLPNPGVLTADNGLSLDTPTNVVLGGSLKQDTDIVITDHILSFTGECATFEVILSNCQSYITFRNETNEGVFDIFAAGKLKIGANNTYGNNGQVLYTNSDSVYWGDLPTYISIPTGLVEGDTLRWDNVNLVWVLANNRWRVDDNLPTGQHSLYGFSQLISGENWNFDLRANSSGSYLDLNIISTPTNTRGISNIINDTVSIKSLYTVERTIPSLTRTGLFSEIGNGFSYTKLGIENNSIPSYFIEFWDDPSNSKVGIKVSINNNYGLTGQVLVNNAGFLEWATRGFVPLPAPGDPDTYLGGDLAWHNFSNFVRGAENGIEIVSNKVRLGGANPLIQNTTLNYNGYSFIQNNGNFRMLSNMTTTIDNTWKLQINGTFGASPIGNNKQVLTTDGVSSKWDWIIPTGGNSGQYLNGSLQWVNFPAIPNVSAFALPTFRNGLVFYPGPVPYNKEVHLGGLLIKDTTITLNKYDFIITHDSITGDDGSIKFIVDTGEIWLKTGNNQFGDIYIYQLSSDGWLRQEVQNYFLRINSSVTGDGLPPYIMKNGQDCFLGGGDRAEWKPYSRIFESDSACSWIMGFDELPLSPLTDEMWILSKHPDDDCCCPKWRKYLPFDGCEWIMNDIFTSENTVEGLSEWVLTKDSGDNCPKWKRLPLTSGGPGNPGLNFQGGENGIYLAVNGKVRLGTNPLIENTVISGGGFNFTVNQTNITTISSANSTIINSAGVIKIENSINNTLGLFSVTSAGEIQIRDGSGSFGTPAYVLTSNGTTASWQPAPGGGSAVNPGTKVNSTLRWSGAAWVEDLWVLISPNAYLFALETGAANYPVGVNDMLLWNKTEKKLLVGSHNDNNFTGSTQVYSLGSGNISLDTIHSYTFGKSNSVKFNNTTVADRGTFLVFGSSNTFDVSYIRNSFFGGNLLNFNAPINTISGVRESFVFGQSISYSDTTVNFTDSYIFGKNIQFDKSVSSVFIFGGRDINLTGSPNSSNFDFSLINCKNLNFASSVIPSTNKFQTWINIDGNQGSHPNPDLFNMTYTQRLYVWGGLLLKYSYGRTLTGTIPAVFTVNDFNTQSSTGDSTVFGLINDDEITLPSSTAAIDNEIRIIKNVDYPPTASLAKVHAGAGNNIEDPLTGNYIATVNLTAGQCITVQKIQSGAGHVWILLSNSGFSGGGGSLPGGTLHDTFRYNGVSWVANSNSKNDGTGIWWNGDSTDPQFPDSVTYPLGGTRMLFMPNKSAFRVGRIDAGYLSSGTWWDDVNIGTDSFAAGLSCMALGSQSISLGAANQAKSQASVVVGQENTAEFGSNASFVSGQGNTTWANVTFIGGSYNSVINGGAFYSTILASNTVTINSPYSFIASADNSVINNQNSAIIGTPNFTMSATGSVSLGINSFVSTLTQDNTVLFQRFRFTGGTQVKIDYQSFGGIWNLGLDDFHIVAGSSGASYSKTFVLPSSPVDGQKYKVTIVDVDSGTSTVSVDVGGSETINGSILSYAITNFDYVTYTFTFVSSLSTWVAECSCAGGGGGGLTLAQNGLYVSGGNTVKLGGNLTEDTNISSNIYLFTLASKVTQLEARDSFSVTKSRLTLDYLGSVELYTDTKIQLNSVGEVWFHCGGPSFLSAPNPHIKLKSQYTITPGVYIKDHNGSEGATGEVLTADASGRAYWAPAGGGSLTANNGLRNISPVNAGLDNGTNPLSYNVSIRGSNTYTFEVKEFNGITILSKQNLNLESVNNGFGITMDSNDGSIRMTVTTSGGQNPEIKILGGGVTVRGIYIKDDSGSYGTTGQVLTAEGGVGNRAFWQNVPTYWAEPSGVTDAILRHNGTTWVSTGANLTVDSSGNLTTVGKISFVELKTTPHFTITPAMAGSLYTLPIPYTTYDLDVSSPGVSPITCDLELSGSHDTGKILFIKLFSNTGTALPGGSTIRIVTTGGELIDDSTSFTFTSLNQCVALKKVYTGQWIKLN